MMDVKAPLPPTPAQPARGVHQRTAEGTDGGTTLDKEDLDRHRRGKSTDVENRERKDIYEDLAEVSVALLRGFLHNLMATRDALETQRREAVRRQQQQPYAMQAYNKGLQAAPDAPPAPLVNEDAEVMGVSRADLAAENLDKGEIRDLMTSLESLEAAGIHYISIEKSSSFLQSIRDAIARAV